MSLLCLHGELLPCLPVLVTALVALWNVLVAAVDQIAQQHAFTESRLPTALLLCLPLFLATFVLRRFPDHATSLPPAAAAAAAGESPAPSVEEAAPLECCQHLSGALRRNARTGTMTTNTTASAEADDSPLFVPLPRSRLVDEFAMRPSRTATVRTHTTASVLSAPAMQSVRTISLLSVSDPPRDAHLNAQPAPSCAPTGGLATEHLSAPHEAPMAPSPQSRAVDVPAAEAARGDAVTAPTSAPAAPLPGVVPTPPGPLSPYLPARSSTPVFGRSLGGSSGRAADDAASVASLSLRSCHTQATAVSLARGAWTWRHSASSAASTAVVSGGAGRAVPQKVASPPAGEWRRVGPENKFVEMVRPEDIDEDMPLTKLVQCIKTCNQYLQET